MPKPSTCDGYHAGDDPLQADGWLDPCTICPDVETREFTPCWESYARNVVATDAGPNQRAETMRAFYSGGLAVMGIAIAISETPENPTQLAADVARFDNLWADIREGAMRAAQG